MEAHLALENEGLSKMASTALGCGFGEYSSNRHCDDDEGDDDDPPTGKGGDGGQGGVTTGFTR